MVVCYLGIGSNLGSRRRNISSALKKLGALKDTKIIRVSRIIETDPVGGPKGQNKFLNAAVKIHTAIPPLALLKELKGIERQLGRTGGRRYGPRVIDLDILFYGNKVIDSRDLKVPHPRLFRRDFVLRPLLQII